MERKLEQRDVTGYLPYDLKMYAGKIEGTELIYPVLGLRNGGRILTYVNGEDEANGEIFMNIKQYNLRPILRPESDMYRTITHNGEEIIPIVELARIAFPERKWKTEINVIAMDDGYTHFGYCENGFYARFDEDIEDVTCQYQLFDCMNSLLIDYRGLIDAGLAVSVYDLDTNPYK